jgi:3-hydroxyacyl-CoA dehydrogenase
MDEQVMKEKLFETVIEFMLQNGITCEETVHQCDWVIENAYEFIEKLFKVVEPLLPEFELD